MRSPGLPGHRYASEHFYLYLHIYPSIFSQVISKSVPPIFASVPLSLHLSLFRFHLYNYSSFLLYLCILTQTLGCGILVPHHTKFYCQLHTKMKGSILVRFTLPEGCSALVADAESILRHHRIMMNRTLMADSLGVTAPQALDQSKVT